MGFSFEKQRTGPHLIVTSGTFYQEWIAMTVDRGHKLDISVSKGNKLRLVALHRNKLKQTTTTYKAC
ncbi:hypothetical protein Q31b_17070 [Novipirellula aureliae]|uniref:Uncharacterized protein n=1 Tax=Novipirellula aureliae TaxID=2527966 RepID=A0A5C6E8Y2_9BACT|nr:hypothetical protein [Novipirellula aureliae]TWU44171.1 hypothetical protein Q31b_17070 [Novipirellula aureliae]